MISKFIKDLTSKYPTSREDLLEDAIEIRDLFLEGDIDWDLDSVSVSFKAEISDFHCKVLENFNLIELVRKAENYEEYNARREKFSYNIKYNNGEGRIQILKSPLSEEEIKEIESKVDGYIKIKPLTDEEMDLIFDLTGIVYE